MTQERRQSVSGPSKGFNRDEVKSVRWRDGSSAGGTRGARESRSILRKAAVTIFLSRRGAERRGMMEVATIKKSRRNTELAARADRLCRHLLEG